MRELSELIGLAEVNTFLSLRAKGATQMRQKQCRKLLALELLENPWIMAELETERQQALRLQPLLKEMGALGGGTSHRLVTIDEVLKVGEGGRQGKKATQRRCIMCGKKASAACQVCHKPSDGQVSYLCGPYTGRDCAAQHMAGAPSRRRRKVSNADMEFLPSLPTTRRRRRSSGD